jgi:hypothetical protein
VILYLFYLFIRCCLWFLERWSCLLSLTGSGFPCRYWEETNSLIIDAIGVSFPVSSTSRSCISISQLCRECKNRGYEKKQTWKLKFQAARSPLYILRFESFTESALIGKLQGNRSYTANMCNTRKEIQQEKIEKKNRIRQHIAVSHIRQYMTVWGILSQ